MYVRSVFLHMHQVPTMDCSLEPTQVAETLQLGCLLKATAFATLKHDGQFRKNKEAAPYITHPLGVCLLLHKYATECRNTPILVAAILHDTVEDTDTTLDEIEIKFGAEVRDLVAAVTDDKSLPKAERKHLQIQNAPTMSKGAKMVKMADKLYNLNDLMKDPPVEWDQERIDAYFEDGQQVMIGCRDADPGLARAMDHLINCRYYGNPAPF